MSTDLVLADNMATLDLLPSDAQELAVTSMLTEARSWLAHAVEATEPQTIANFKARMATVAEATKQIGLSKDIQLDAQEMVRRAERGLGKAIRKAQVDGSVNSVADTRGFGGAAFSSKAKPTDFASKDDLVKHIYPLTDGVTDPQFEGGITSAKAEGNLSAANVLRKIRVRAYTEADRARLDRIEELAAAGWTSDKIGHDLGHVEAYIRRLAREAGIDVPGDKAMGRSRRRINHDRILQQTVTSLEGMVMALELLDLNEVDLTHSEEWVTSLTESIRVLNRLNKQIKEMTQ